ncbi:UNVERIFIED_CONTAM: hypothetical protein PYX00_011331 [Menopon gallinae]|uniref:AB hydrolase-1 domain-containing protein n=1 Tax=Menopon gallinae TaxID=328185 RepID=A0AAW2H7B3_9NEOP
MHIHSRANFLWFDLLERIITEHVPCCRGLAMDSSQHSEELLYTHPINKALIKNDRNPLLKMLKFVLVLFYLIFYSSLVQRPRILYQQSKHNLSIVKSIRVFNARFWPFFIYGFGYLQSKLYQFRPTHARSYKQLFVKARDGEMIEIDLYEKDTSPPLPETERCNKAPETQEVSDSVLNNVLLVHGFNGSSRSTYIKSLAYYLRGHRVFAFNARGILSELRTPRFFHIGWTEDLEDVVQYILDNYKGSVFLVGFSMGSSWVTNYLARADDPRVVAGVGVCVPFNFYKINNIFRSTLKARLLAGEYRKYLGKHAVFKSYKFNFSSVEEIDRNLTLKVFGFLSCDEYYQRESCEEKLMNIKKPALFINTRDDPIIPYHTIPTEKIKKNPNLILCVVRAGGHLGFLGANWYKSFADEAIVDFLAAVERQHMHTT